MLFSKILIDTINKEKGAIILFLCNTLAVALFYYLLYGTTDIVYPIVLAAFFLIIYILYKFTIYKKLYVQIEEALQSPGYNINENWTFSKIIYDIKKIHSKYLDEIYKIESSNKEREDLIVEWIHNMKTSVAVIELAINKLPEDNATEDIKLESNLLKDNLEGALNIFRLEEFSKDYVPEATNLKEFIKEIVNEQKRNFIYSNIYPVIEIEDDISIYTDKKWGKYVITQIVSNAIKYSNSGNKVYIKAKKSEENVSIYIEDSGIGIKNEEISRVFEAFYTGSNGRKKTKSSGIGLYMCKSICEKINSKISLISKEGSGTTVEVTFQRCKVM